MILYLQTNGCYDENAGLSGGEVKLYRANSANVETIFPYRYDCDQQAGANISIYLAYLLSEPKRSVGAVVPECSTRRYAAIFRKHW